MRAPRRAKAGAHAADSTEDANMTWLERRLVRHVQRAAITRWLERARAAEAIVWLAEVEAEAIRTTWEFFRCLIGDGR